MAFELLSFVDPKNQHYYYFVDRFTYSTKRDLYNAVFSVPKDEDEEPGVYIEIPEDLVLFRFKVNVENIGSFMFFLEKDEFIKHKDQYIEKVKKLKQIENDDLLKVQKLLNNICKMKPLLVGFYDEREEDISFADIRKPFLREHIECKVIIFRKATLDAGTPKPKKESSFITDAKLVWSGMKKFAHGIKVAALAVVKAAKWTYKKVLKPAAKGIVKAAKFVGKCAKKFAGACVTCAKVIAYACVWIYYRVLKPVGFAISIACVKVWKVLKKIFIPLGLYVWRGLKWIGKQSARFFRWIGRGISKVSPRLLPFLKKVFVKTGHGIKVASICIWRGIKKFGIFIGGFFKSFGIVAWKCIKGIGKYSWIAIKFLAKWSWIGIKKLGKYLWIFIKCVGKWLGRFFVWLGKQLKKLFTLIGHGIRHLPKYLEWKSDYSFYVIFSILFSFALLCGTVWALNGDGLSVFFYVMTALFMLICVYATYIQRKDHKDWTVTAKNTITPNLAIFLGLTAGIISSYFTAQAIVKVAEGKVIDYGLALWITIGVSAFLLIALNFTPFIIHKVKDNPNNNAKQQNQKQPEKTEENPQIAGENINNQPNEGEQHE